MLLHILFVMLRFDQNLQKNLSLDLKMKLKKKIFLSFFWPAPAFFSAVA